MEKSLELANKAAGIVVGKTGTSKISLDELFNKQISLKEKTISIKNLK